MQSSFIPWNSDRALSLQVKSYANEDFNFSQRKSYLCNSYFTETSSSASIITTTTVQIGLPMNLGMIALSKNITAEPWYGSRLCSQQRIMKLRYEFNLGQMQLLCFILCQCTSNAEKTVSKSQP
jgi:hypothetical protein